MITLSKKRGTCLRSGLSLISVHIRQTLVGDHGVSVDTGCRAELATRFCEAPRRVPASEPIVQIAAGRQDGGRNCFDSFGRRVSLRSEGHPETVDGLRDGRQVVPGCRSPLARGSYRIRGSGHRRNIRRSEGSVCQTFASCSPLDNPKFAFSSR